MTAPGESPPRFDAFLPPEMAVRAEEVGVTKARLPTAKVLLLAVLAGAFISMGGAFSTTVSSRENSGTEQLGPAMHYGGQRLLAGVAFSLGLVLVVVAGAELFTGNNLIVMAWASGRVTTVELLRNWGLAYAGNFAGAVATALLLFLCGQYQFAGGGVGIAALEVAAHKCRLDFWQAFMLGIPCNALVCLAVWLCYSARTTTDKILSIVPPITAFVACGFEHSIANMYFVPLAIFVKEYAGDAFWAGVPGGLEKYAGLHWMAFLGNNLIPVTLGNIVGGSGLVGFIYWLIYSRGRQPKNS